MFVEKEKIRVFEKIILLMSLICICHWKGHKHINFECTFSIRTYQFVNIIDVQIVS